MKLELRKYIAQILIGWAFDLLPGSEFKTGLADLIINKIDKI